MDQSIIALTFFKVGSWYCTRIIQVNSQIIRINNLIFFSNAALFQKVVLLNEIVNINSFSAQT